MISYTNIFESSDGGFILRLGVDTTGFDFSSAMRSARVIINAVNTGAEPVVAVSSGTIGSLEIFGRIFQLPESFVAKENSETAIIELNLTEISNNLYVSCSPFTVQLNYISESCSLTAVRVVGSIDFPAIPDQPEFSISCGRNMILGENVTVTSPLLGDGYILSVALYDGETLLISKTVAESDNVFYADPDWAYDHPDEESFDVTFRVSASLGNITLPNVREYVTSCAVSDSDGLPVAAVTQSFVYDGTVPESFGVAIVNRTYLKITVSDPVCSYGATLSQMTYNFDGIRLPEAPSASYPITTIGTHKWSVSLKDSRGKVRYYSGSVIAYEYGPPEFEASVSRVMVSDSPNEDICFRITPIKLYSFGGNNVYSYAYRYRNCSDDSFTGWISAQSDTDVTVSAGMELNNMYELQIRASDTGGQSTSHSYLINCTRTDLHIARNRLGIGKKAETPYFVDCAWDVRCDGDISIAGSEGSPISLRDVCENLLPAVSSNVGVRTLGYRSYVVTTESGISEVVENPYELVGNCGLCLVAVYVAATGLSLNSGLHLYMVFNDGVRRDYVKL